MSEKTFPSDDLPEIRIRRVHSQTHQELQNIADNLGVTMTDFLRPKMKEIANSYPEAMKIKKRDS